MKQERVEIRNLAAIAGAEEDEIDDMIEGDRVFVARKKRIIVGFISVRYRTEEKCFEISGLAVDERERRRGLATLLLKHAEGFARDKTVDKLTTKTNNDNIPALALYQKAGFKITEVRIGALIAHHKGKEIQGWSKIPVRDEIVLEKNLSN